jgi:hypothetical protein
MQDPTTVAHVDNLVHSVPDGGRGKIETNTLSKVLTTNKLTINEGIKTNIYSKKSNI